MQPERDGLAIEERLDAGRLVVAAAGDIDVANVERLQAALRRATEARPAELWLDLTEVAFMDSTGVTALVLAHRELDGSPPPLTLICPEGPVRRLLELTGLDGVFAIHADRDAAERGSVD